MIIPPLSVSCDWVENVVLPGSFTISSNVPEWLDILTRGICCVAPGVARQLFSSYVISPSAFSHCVEIFVQVILCIIFYPVKKLYLIRGQKKRKKQIHSFLG